MHSNTSSKQHGGGAQSLAGHERIRGQLAWRKDALIRERANLVRTMRVPRLSPWHHQREYLKVTNAVGFCLNDQRHTLPSSYLLDGALVTT